MLAHLSKFAATFQCFFWGAPLAGPYRSPVPDRTHVRRFRRASPARGIATRHLSKSVRPPHTPGETGNSTGARPRRFYLVGRSSLLRRCSAQGRATAHEMFLKRSA